ncbi:hypothetical protein K469DRAFT_762004 [Zopfia rhizophila CBS 207.26]|uniref:Uncharacterized protein n=1 Tax=Zopfia rhizophila CBS 207.26 TaxID=1314779 RepID=A0A6A6EI50_9PEZI|nr:hypothetical protein K469DRAFT_762004 [Zopfia rhizophila CBS 207.26]
MIRKPSKRPELYTRTASADLDRWGADIFSWKSLHYPLNVLALTSRLRQLVQDCCSHLAKANNRFNLPLGEEAPKYPDLARRVYERL